MENENIPEDLHCESYSQISKVPIFIKSVRSGWAGRDPTIRSKSSPHKEIMHSISIIEAPSMKIPGFHKIVEESKDFENDQIEQIDKIEALEVQIDDQVPKNSKRRGTLLISNPIHFKDMIQKRKASQLERSLVCDIVKSIKKRQPYKDIHVSKFSKISNYQQSENLEQSQLSTVIPECYFKKCECASILVVDDQVINRMILCEFGNHYGIKSDQADNGKVAYQMYIKSLSKT